MAHKGEPGNEIVDHLAAQAAQQQGSHDLQDWHDSLLKANIDQEIEWLWLLHHPDRFSFDLDGNLSMPCSPSTTPLQEVFAAGHEDQDHPGEPGETIHNLTLKRCTCNVLTLGDKPKEAGNELGIAGPARQTAIIQQLKSNGVSIFGLQETRLKRQHKLQDDDYRLFHASATDKGHYGVMLGFSKTLRIGSRKAFRDQDLSIIAKDPRYIVVKVHNDFFRCIVIVAHAPHNGNPGHHIEAWWAALLKSIPNRYEEWDTILLTDANAHVGSEPCRHIGNHQAEAFDSKSEAFEMRFELWTYGSPQLLQNANKEMGTPGDTPQGAGKGTTMSLSHAVGSNTKLLLGLQLLLTFPW